MKEQLCEMGTHELTSLYENEFDKLKLLLFRAEDWATIKVQQKLVADISAVVHERLFLNPNPAEHKGRRK